MPRISLQMRRAVPQHQDWTVGKGMLQVHTCIGPVFRRDGCHASLYSSPLWLLDQMAGNILKLTQTYPHASSWPRYASCSPSRPKYWRSRYRKWSSKLAGNHHCSNSNNKKTNVQIKNRSGIYDIYDKTWLSHPPSIRSQLASVHQEMSPLLPPGQHS